MASPGTDGGVGLPALARSGSRVLLVGTGRHPDGGPLPAVPAVAASLRDLAEALGEHGRVPAANIRNLLDPPTPVEFGRAVSGAAAEATDTLLIHYIGHGLVDADGLYLATGATDDLMVGLPYTALSYSALRHATRDSRARAIAIVLDCCFAGRDPVPAGPPPLDAVFEQTLVRGGFLLASTARDEHGLAVPGAAHTAFTGALIRLLREGDPGGPELLTLDHVYRYLVRVLPRDGAPRPRRYVSDHAGELVLARNPAHRPRPVPAPSPTQQDAPGPGRAPCPYRGLSAFGPEDAGLFFGRAGIVAELTRRITGGGLIAVVGASGCGKTSVLRAGVVPALEALPGGWTVATMTPGADPVRTLAERAAALAALPAGESGVLLVDQFEELFTTGAPAEQRDGFVRDLAALAASPVAVVFAVRADFYEACTHFPTLVRALEGRQLVVGPMAQDELRTVIERPARLAGLRLEEGLADTLLREARVRRHGEQSAVLPLLSHALLATWQQRFGDLLTVAGYRAAGGIDQAIARTAENIYAAVPEEDRPHVRALLVRLVRLGEGVEDTRRRLPLTDLTEIDRLDAVRRVLNVLAAARLVTVDGDGIEIAHEALLYAWPRLRSWIDEDRTALMAVQQVTDAARAWDQAGRQDTDLYRGPRLDTATDAVRERDAVDALGPIVRLFLDRCHEQRRVERRAARRRIRRGRLTIAVVTVLALVAATVGVISVRASEQAAQKAAVVRSTQLAADAEAVRSTDPGLAAQLAIAAYRAAPIQDATGQLYASLSTPLDSTVAATGSRVLRVATQPDGPLAAAGDQDGSLRILSFADPAAPVLESTIRAGGAGVAIAPGGRLLGGECPAGDGLCLWRLTDPRHPTVAARLPPPTDLTHEIPNQIMSLAISADGALLAAAAEQGSTLLWSIVQPTHPRLVAEVPNPGTDPATLVAVAFDPRAPLLAETNQRGSTSLWNVADPAAPMRLGEDATGYQAIAFNPAGTLLAAAGDLDIGLWHIDNPSRQLVPVQFAPPVGQGRQNIRALAFSPDGTQLAWSGEDTTDANSALAVLDLSPGDLSSGVASPTITPAAFGTVAMAYTPAGGLVTGGADGMVRLWRSALPRAGDVTVNRDSAWDISRDGRLLATPTTPVDSDSGTTTWNLTIRDISGPAGPVLDATVPVQAQFVDFLSPTALLTVAHDGTVQLWDLRDPRRPNPVAALGVANAGNGDLINYAASVTADAAGDLVAIRGDDDLLHLWRITAAPGAVEVGAFPDVADAAGVLADGSTAIALQPTGIDLWNIGNPARPVHGTSVGVPNMNKGEVASVGTIAAAVAPTEVGCGCSTLRLFTIADGRPDTAATLTTTAGSGVAISGDDRLLAATGADNKTVTLWNVGDPGHPHQQGALLAGQQISDISFSPDRTQLAISDAGTVRLWDVGDPSAPLLTTTVVENKTNSPDIGSVKFVPTSRTLAVATTSAVLLFDDDPAELANRLCTYVGNRITPEQWQRYAPGVSYENPCPR